MCSLKCMSDFFFSTLGAAFHSAADTAATSRGAPTGLGDAENEAEGTRCRRTGEAGGEVGEALGAESDSASKGEPRLREESANPHAVAPRTPAAAVLSFPTRSPRFCAPSPRGAEHVKH